MTLDRSKVFRQRTSVGLTVKRLRPIREGRNVWWLVHKPNDPVRDTKNSDEGKETRNNQDEREETGNLPEVKCNIFRSYVVFPREPRGRLGHRRLSTFGSPPPKRVGRMDWESEVFYFRVSW